MIEAYVVRAAIRRAQQQFGIHNVHLSSQFARLLAINSVVFKTFDEADLKNAFLGPIDCGSFIIDESNAMWFVPKRKLSRAAFTDGIIALNRTRRQCGLKSVKIKTRPITVKIG